MMLNTYRLVSVNEVGWRSFDVTQAVHYWSKSMTKSPLHLEVRIEGERPGSYAAEMAKRVRFTTQNILDSTAGTPELILYTLNLEEYGLVYNRFRLTPLSCTLLYLYQQCH